jgi:tetratricopeptide (TPR) repeat protein
MMVETEYRALLDRARAFLALRQYGEAIPLFVDATVQAPGDSAPKCLLAQCHLGMNQPGDALTAADGAVASSPENAWAHRVRAQALKALGRHDEALDAARTAASLPASENLASLTTRLLRARRRRLAGSLPDVEGLISGSVVQEGQRCGVVLPQAGGRTRTVDVPAAAAEAVRRGAAVSAQVREVSEEISAINVELLSRGELH